MIDIEQVIDRSRRLEDLLRQHYHAKGSDLTQLIQSCENRFSQDILDKLNKIATMSKQIIADEKTLDNDYYNIFIELCTQCEKDLTPRSSRFVWGTVIILLGGFTIAALGFYIYHWQHIKL